MPSPTTCILILLRCFLGDNRKRRIFATKESIAGRLAIQSKVPNGPFSSIASAGMDSD